MVLVLRGVGRALVQGHEDVGPQGELDLDGPLGGQEVPGPIQMRLERDPVFRDVPETGQTQHLVAAAVRQDGPVPSHEPVQAAERLDDLVSGPQVEVIGVAQDQRAAFLVQVSRVQGLDRGLRPAGHEDGGLHHAMRGGQSPPAGAGPPIGCEEFEAHGPAGTVRGTWRVPQRISMASP